MKGKYPIHIKKSHAGLFTKKAKKSKMSVQEFASHVLSHRGQYDNGTLLQAQFAKNASKFKH